ncbi:MAG: hypothetical protein KY395_04320 [Actinobacteria bacterium]|nr:hypothetical protein [Actinomycetota bacterium]
MHDRYVPAASVAVTVVVIAALSVAGSLVANRVDDWVGHGLGHAVVAVPIAALAVFALRVWPAPKSVAPARASRRVVITGLAGVAIGQVLEVLGARVGEPTASNVEELAHTAGQIVTMLSMLALLVGAVLAGTAAARARTAPKWAVVLATALAMLVVGFLLFGGPVPRS